MDTESLQPLPGATIVIVDTEPVKGTISDIDGNFVLEKVPVVRQSLKVNFIGYEPLIVPELMIGSGKEIYLEIKLVESITTLGEVAVVATKNERALNEMATLSSKSRKYQAYLHLKYLQNRRHILPLQNDSVPGSQLLQCATASHWANFP